jgi:hypothetical protein
MRRLSIAVAILIASAARSLPALADAYDATLARAIAAKERALDTNDPASWEDALALFQQADRIRSTKETKYELGSAAARLRQDDLAVEAFESALALGLEGGARDKARAFVDEHDAQMGRLEIAGPEGGEIYVGTRLRGTLPLGRPLVVFAGKSRLRVVLGAREARIEISVTAGQTQQVDFAPRFADTAEPEPPPGPLPAPPPPAPAPQPVDPGPEPESNALGWALAIGGGAAALVGTGLVIGSSATIDSRRERLADLCAVPNGTDECTTAQPGKRADAQSEVDAIATWKAVRIGGWVGLGAGVAVAATGIILLAGGSKPRESAQWTVVPTRGGATIAFTGAL